MSSDSSSSSDESEKVSTISLIYAVKRRPAIWQVKHPDRNNIRVISKLWNEIQESFPKFTVEILKKKWKNAKDQFRKEIKKYPIRADGDPETNSSSWGYFDHMVFLASEISFKKPNNFIPESDPLLNSTLLIGKNKKKKIFPEGIDLETDDISSGNENIIEDVTPAPTQEANVPMHSKRKNLDTTLRQDFSQMDRKKVKIQDKNLEAEVPPEFQNSDDYHFFMSLIPQMADMPIIMKLKIRSKMLQAIIDESETVKMKI